MWAAQLAGDPVEICLIVPALVHLLALQRNRPGDPALGSIRGLLLREVR